MTSSPTHASETSNPTDFSAAKSGKRPIDGKANEAAPKTAPDELVPPHLQAALYALEAEHALEWRELERLEGIAKLMDAQFALPFTPIRLGLDSLVGLIPGVGDTISFGVAGFIIVQAGRLGASFAQVLRMILNSFIDWLIGLVPLIGDLLDVGWRSNLRNTEYLREILEAKWAKERADLLKG